MNVSQIKEAVRRRDGQRCTRCGMDRDEHLAKYGRELDVHRVTPGSAYSLDDGCCVTVCRTCHASLPKSDHNTSGQRGRLLPARVSESMWADLVRLAKSERRSISQMVNILLEEELTLMGRWPPPPASSTQP